MSITAIMLREPGGPEPGIPGVEAAGEVTAASGGPLE